MAGQEKVVANNHAVHSVGVLEISVVICSYIYIHMVGRATVTFCLFCQIVYTMTGLHFGAVGGVEVGPLCAWVLHWLS